MAVRKQIREVKGVYFVMGTSFGPAPWYGEIEYTGRMVKLGWNSGHYPRYK
jgi:tryptophan synthase beta subunit